MTVRPYWSIFYAFNGPGPYACYFCHGTIAGVLEQVGDLRQRLNRRQLVVHHVDEDRMNNDPENLSAAHRGCHVAHHSARPHSDATRAQISATWKQKYADGFKHPPLTTAQRVNLAKGRSQVSQDRTPTMCECGAGPFKGRAALKHHQTKKH